MQRRTLLKGGLAAGALLAAGSVALFGGRDPVRDRDTVLAGVVPALLAGALPGDGAARTAEVRDTVAAVGAAADRLAPAVQDELARLFALLASAPGRRLLAGLDVDWPQAPAERVAAFLEGWRAHRLGVFRAGYGALHDLVLGAWYADETRWTDIGYAGPPAL